MKKPYFSKYELRMLLDMEMEHISPPALYLLTCSLLFLAYKAPNIEEVYIGLACHLSMWYVMLKPA